MTQETICKKSTYPTIEDFLLKLYFYYNFGAVGFLAFVSILLPGL